MKLRSILFLLISSIPCLASTNTLQDMQDIKNATLEFLELKKNSKNEWLDLMKAEKMDKANLIQKHANQWADLKIKNLKSMPDTFDATTITQLKKEHLLQAIDLYEQQGKDWESTCADNVQKAKDLAIKTKADFKSYKQKYGLATAEAQDDEFIIEIDDEEIE
jgi:Holliday junction resolvase-like predicted endonuclease